MRISDWSSDVCSSDLRGAQQGAGKGVGGAGVERVDVVDGGVEQLCQRDHVVAGGGLVQADADRSVVDAAQVDAGLRGPGVDCGRVHAGDVQRVEEITAAPDAALADRKGVVEGKSGSVRVELVGCRLLQKKK